jgi:hypothetical protein
LPSAPADRIFDFVEFSYHRVFFFAVFCYTKPMENEGRRLLALANEAREKEQFFEAFDLGDQAMIAFDKIQDDAGYAEA